MLAFQKMMGSMMIISLKFYRVCGRKITPCVICRLKKDLEKKDVMIDTNMVQYHSEM